MEAYENFPEKLKLPLLVIELTTTGIVLGSPYAFQNILINLRKGFLVQCNMWFGE